MPTLDVIIATHDREASLVRALESLLACRRPPGLDVRITVADNNSTDGTRRRVETLAKHADLPIAYLFEPRAGKSAAANRAIASSAGDLLAFFDDDEQALPDWLTVVAESFRDPHLDFITGRYLPRWLAPRPDWLPARRLGLVGAVDPGDEGFRIADPLTAQMFLGGNSVARRGAVLAAGGFAEWLRYGEDAEFGIRLVRGGARGRYVPALRVLHDIPAARLTRPYLRRRAMLNHAGAARIARRWPEVGPLTLGFPLRLAYYRLRSLAAHLPALLRARADAPTRFEAELLLWDLAGLVRGWARRDETDRPGATR